MSKQIWQKELKNSITTVTSLCQHLGIELPYTVNQHFPIKVTPLYLSLIEKNNPYDPLLLQVLTPQTAPHASFTQDPLDEKTFRQVPGLIHKYTNRVLITFSGACMIHCQYCFRQHFPYSENLMTPQNWHQIITYIKTHEEINEVILSGGDPFTASNVVIAKKLAELEEINHITTIRFHTRIPAVMPCRFDEELISILKNCKKTIVIVTHINHPQELCDENRIALKQLAQNHMIFNQSVLLKHVNDCPKVLADLSERLFASSIVPYYLHQLDPVSSTEFYYLEDHEISSIYSQLRGKISGYLLPRLVKEIAGETSKSPVI